MKKILMSFIFLIVSNNLMSQNTTSHFPRGINGFTKQPCSMVSSVILSSHHDANYPQMAADEFINMYNEASKEKIKIIKYQNSNSIIDFSSTDSFEHPEIIMSNFVYAYHNKEIKNGTQYLAGLVIADLTTKKIIGTVFIAILTMIPHDGCIVIPFYYTDFLQGELIN